MDTFLIPIISLIVGVPFVVSLIFYKYIRKYLWGAPLIALMITSVMFIFNDIRFVNGALLDDRFNIYFHELL